MFSSSNAVFLQKFGLEAVKLILVRGTKLLFLPNPRLPHTDVQTNKQTKKQKNIHTHSQISSKQTDKQINNKQTDQQKTVKLCKQTNTKTK